jgi:hypothetical protein
VSQVINAAPELVYRTVSAMDRMPERSPEQQRFEWTGGTPGEAGATFRGWNRSFGLTWWTNGWITEADEPRILRFETSTIYGDRQERTNRWSYSLEPHGTGTLVVERLETIRLPIHLKLLGPLLVIRRRQIRSGMAQTLRCLAQECEATSG